MGYGSYLELVLADGFRLALMASERASDEAKRLLQLESWPERFAHNASGPWPINCSSRAPVDSFETLRIISAKMVRHWLALTQPGIVQYSKHCKFGRITAESERFIELRCSTNKERQIFPLISSRPRVEELRGKLCPSD